MVDRPVITEQQVWAWLDAVPDPEIPVVSVVDLGIVRAVRIAGDECTVTVTPTYSGCPAIDMILESIGESLRDKGIRDVRLEMQLSPAWTTDWISAKGRQRLESYGIAPPAATARTQSIDVIRQRPWRCSEPQVPCPRCASADTRVASQFGSTACKALYVCNNCLEPFDYFKCH